MSSTEDPSLVEQHPLVRLAHRVRQGDLDLSQALEEASRPEIVATVDEETLGVLNGHVKRLALEDPQMAYALACLDDAIASHVAGPLLRAHCALRMGAAALDMGHVDLAQQSFERALECYREQGDLLGEANALQGIGYVQYFQCQWDRALESFERALGLYREMGDRPGEANALQGIGKVQQFQDSKDQALESFEQALGLYREMGDRPGEASILVSIGDVQRVQSQRDRALESYKQALEICQEVGDLRGEAGTLWGIGKVQRLQGQYDQALESFERALGLYREVGDRWGEAYTLTEIGEVQRSQDQWDRALESLAQAREIHQAVGDRLGEANVLRGIGEVQHSQGQLDQALESYQQAWELHRAVEDRLGEASALWGIGEVQRLQGQYDQALGSFEQALGLHRVIGDRLGEAGALWGIGQVQHLQNQWDQALESFGQALGVYRALRDQLGEASALLSIGEVQRLQGQYDQALGSFEQALGLHRVVGDRSVLINIHNAIGQVYQQQGQLCQAHQAYRDALTYVEELRSLQQREGSRRVVLDQVASLYMSMVYVCMELGRSEEGWHWAERGKGRTLLDRLGNARPRLDSREKQETYEEWQRLEQEAFALEERLRQPGQSEQRAADLLERLTRVRQEEARRRQQVAQMLDEGRELVQVSVPPPEQLALSLCGLARCQDGRPGPRPLLVEYFLLEGVRYVVFLLPLWQVAPGQPLPLGARQVSLPEGTLERIADRFESGLTAARRGFAGRYRGEAPAGAQGLSETEREVACQAALEAFAALQAELGEAFVRPWTDVLEELKPTELLLVPNGALHSLPLHMALLDDTPLIERYPLLYLSNAALSQTLLRRRHAGPRPEGRLVMGPPEEDLPCAWVETQGLAESWGLKAAGQPYVLERMRVQVLRDHARQVERAHLSTHSAFDSKDYLRSHIQFFEEWLTLAGLISDETLDFHGMRLFYLSSCESGLAHPGAADELQGLVWALIYAGAGAVMASLWPVDDGAAEYMASAFYYHWKPGTSLMEAYQRTMEQLRKEPDFENPYYWGPFVLFGDGF